MQPVRSIIQLLLLVQLLVSCNDETLNARQTTKPDMNAGALTYKNPIKNILNQSCATCHSLTPSGGASAGFTLDSYEDQGSTLGVKSMLPRIRARVDKRTMPPFADDLSAADRKTILNWIDRGAPQRDMNAGAPKAVLLSPLYSNELADAAYDIKLSFAQVSEDAKWSLYFSYVQGATSGGTPIALDQSTRTTRYTWNTSALSDGDYYIYLVLTDDGASATAVASGSVKIAHAIKSAPTYYGDAKAILDQACVSCHSVTPTNGAPASFALDRYADAGSTKGARSMLAAIKNRVADGTMPPLPATLSADQKNKLMGWINGGGVQGTIPPPPASPTPTMYFTAPATANLSATTSFTIVVDFMGVDASATWDVFYSTSADDQSPVTPIQLGLSTAVKGLSWNVTNLADGTYYLYGIVRSGGASSTVKAFGTVRVTHPVTTSFVHPSAGGEAADASFAAEVGFTGAGATATWSLYRATTPGATTGGVLIAASIPIATTQVNWNTSGVTAGLYYLYTVVSDRGTSSAQASTGGVSISHPAPANASPTLSLTSPNGNQTLFAGTNASITYTAADADGDPLSFNIDVSADGGATWSPLVSNHTLQNYTWAISGGQAEGIAYRVRVTASDGLGGSAVDASDANFGVAAAAMSFATVIQPILASYCGPCHAGGGSQVGAFAYNDYQNGSTTGSFDLMSRIKARTGDDSMPPGPSKLSAAEKAKLQLWIWDGAAP